MRRTIQWTFWPLVTGYWLLSLAGCAKLHAKNPPDVPPLEVPAPPPRVVESSDAEPPPPAVLPEEPAHHPSSAQRRPPPAVVKPEPAKPEPAKPDQAPPPPVADQAAKPPEETKPATTLQTIPTGAEGEMERTIRAQLTRAMTDLNRVDYRALNADARTQYESAKALVRQAEEALRAKNLVFAKSLGDKAAALAAQLAGK